MSSSSSIKYYFEISLLIFEMLYLHYYAIIIILVENGLKTAILSAIISGSIYCPAKCVIVYSPMNIPNADGDKLTFCLVFILIGDQRIVCFIVFIQHTFSIIQQQPPASRFECLSWLRTLRPPILTKSELSAEY